MIEYESNLAFEFDESYVISKFDDTSFYRDVFNSMSKCKSIDFLAANERKYVFIEVKNCVGNESENRWRISPNNTKRDTVQPTVDRSDRDSLDIEVAQKIAMTISALFGAYTNPPPHSKAEACNEITEALFCEKIHHSERQIIVILVLDGEFSCRTRSDKVIRGELQRSLMRKLKWLNCIVYVTDSKGFPSDKLGIRISASTA